MPFLIQTPSQLAAHLRALRTAKGWSQAQLGAKLSLSQARIARIEKDPLSISVAQFLRVLSAVDASMALVAGPTRPELSAMADADLNVKSNQGDW